MFEDADGGGGADAGGASGNHFAEVVEGADAAGGFDAHFTADDAAHELNVFGGGAGGGEAGGGLDEIGASFFRSDRGADFFFEGEERGLEDDFADGTAAMAGFDDAADVGFDDVVLAGFERADVDDHVDFLSAELDGLLGFEDFYLRESGAEGKPGDGADFDVGAAKELGGEGDVPGVDADGSEAEAAGLFAELGDVSAGGVGLEQGVVDEAGDRGVDLGDGGAGGDAVGAGVDDAAGLAGALFDAGLVAAGADNVVEFEAG